MIEREPHFTHDDFEVLEHETLYRGFFRVDGYRLRHRLFQGGWTGVVSRELFVRGHAVAVLLYDPKRDIVVLCEQFRIGALEERVGPWQLEMVAGMVEEGEELTQVAMRESREEAGCVPERLVHVVDYLVSPGGTSEKICIYCGIVDSSQLTPYHGLEEEAEDIRLIPVSADAAFRAVREGEINNAATIIALQWLELNRATMIESESR